MASISNILSVVENLDNEDSKEEQWAKILRKFEQQCPKERAKRLSFEFAIEKCKCSLRDINFAFALNQVQNRSFSNFRTVLEQNLKLQEKLVGKTKLHDWEMTNGLWRFKFNALQEQKEKMVQLFRKQQDLWEMRMRSIPEHYMQKNRRLFEEKQRKLLELQEQWKIRREPLENKHDRTNKHFQAISSALDSSEKIVASLKQEAEKLEAEIKRLNASKLQEIRLIKDLEGYMKEREHKHTKEIEKREKSKNYRRTTQSSCIDVFKVSPFPVLKMQKVPIRKSILEAKDLKILIEDRKRYAPLTTKIPQKLASLPKQIGENISQRENNKPEKIENVELKQDKPIKILEHIVLKCPAPGTTKDADGRMCSKIPNIFNILYQNKHPTDAQNLEQFNTEGDGGKHFDLQQMKQDLLHRTRMGEKGDVFHKTESNTEDENEINQANNVEYVNVFEKQMSENILKQEELKNEEKEDEKKHKIVIENDEFKRGEKRGIAGLANEINPEYVSSSKVEEKQHPTIIDYREKELNFEKVETGESRKFESQEFPVIKTSNNVKKRKSDKPSSVEENLNAKQFKFKGDNYGKSNTDSKPVQRVRDSIGENSGAENEMENILRKAFELCGVPENSDRKSEVKEINSNDDFESFCNQFRKPDLHSKDPEKTSDHNSDDFSGWAAFGNKIKLNEGNNEDNDFFK